MNERFIVKGTRIKDTSLDEYLTLREVCKQLNIQDTMIKKTQDKITRIHEVLDPK